MQRALDRSAPQNTLNNEESNFRWFARYCDNDVFAADVQRPDVRQLSYEEYEVEVAFWASAVPWLSLRVPNRAGIAGMAKPSSIMAILRGVKRAHKRHGIDTVPLAAAVRRCDALLRDYVELHGPEALVPRRKEPLTNELIVRLLYLPAGTPLPTRRSPRRCVDWASPEFSSLRALFSTLAQTGMRKAEVSLDAGSVFSKVHLSMANVRWVIGGTLHVAPSAELLRSLSDGDYALLTPPPSKSDQFALHWGASTVYLRFYSSLTAHPICAARDLAAEELRRCVPPERRRGVPLFARTGDQPWRHADLVSVFSQMLTVIVGAEAAASFSMHSFRIYLACALLSAGASAGTIQAMLRWRSDDALKIYARINDYRYADDLDRAARAKVSSIRTTTTSSAMLGEMAACAAGAVGCREAGFQGYWQAVAGAVAAGDMVPRDRLPPVDDVASSLSNELDSLAIRATREDREDAES